MHVRMGVCLTVGVTVVGMSDTAKAFLSSCVPDLQRMRGESNQRRGRLFNDSPVCTVSLLELTVRLPIEFSLVQ